MVNKVFSIRRLRTGIIFTGVGLIFVVLFLVFFKEDGINNNLEKGKLRALKNQNVINIAELKNNPSGSNRGKFFNHKMNKEDFKLKMEEIDLKKGNMRNKFKHYKNKNNKYKIKNNKSKGNENENENKKINENNGEVKAEEQSNNKEEEKEIKKETVEEKENIKVEQNSKEEEENLKNEDEMLEQEKEEEKEEDIEEDLEEDQYINEFYDKELLKELEKELEEEFEEEDEEIDEAQYMEGEKDEEDEEIDENHPNDDEGKDNEVDVEKAKGKEEEKEEQMEEQIDESKVYNMENFDMKEYAKTVHLESTLPMTTFKLYHQGRNYRDKDDPEGKECPIPWKWVDNQEDSDIIAMNVLDNLGEILRIEHYSYDKRRQKLLLMSMESTSNYNVMLTKKKYFDYMIDYRLDSDVPIPYSYTFFKFDKPAVPLKQKGRGGRGLAAVFISNCGARNERLEYLRELMRYTKIDSFGMCAHNKEVYPEDDATSAWDTKMNTIRKYKFTLAFENSNDRDYVTEKFFQPLEAGSVPVFYGTSNIADFAPPHSFINANDFASAKELAEYLEFLDKNDAEYESYLEWKKTGNWGDNFRRVLEIRKINSICYLLQRIKGQWINPYLTIWKRNDVSEKERACGLC